MRLLLRYAESRALLPTMAACLATGLLPLALHAVLLQVPFASELVTVPVLFLLPLVPALLSLASLSFSLESLEETSRHRMVGLRALHALALLGAGAGGAVFALTVGQDVAHVHLLNGLHLIGLLVLCTALMGAETGWLPVVAWAAITFFAGKDPWTGHPRDWAVLLQTGPAAWTAAIALALLGTAAYAVLGPGRAARRV